MGEGASRSCFVLTTAAPPATEIRDHTDGLMDQVLGPALQHAGYTAVRMDSLAEPGKVTDAVLRHLRNDDLVVADLSFGDPTVMYALGVRHSFGMSAIHVRTPSVDLPFDTEGLIEVVIDLTDMVSVKRARKEVVARIEEIDEAEHDRSPVLATVELDVMRDGLRDDQGSTPAPVVNALKAIEQRLGMVENHLGAAGSKRSSRRSRRVFIVHGHDDGLKHQLARMLTALQFDVVILQEQADSGRTLLDKLRAEVEDIGFVFVLLTPDDIAAPTNEPEKQATRARQNVIYEYGMFAGLIDPSRVCAIQRGEIELPSDLYGLVVKKLPDNTGIEAIQLDLLHELKRAGYQVDANQLMQ